MARIIGGMPWGRDPRRRQSVPMSALPTPASTTATPRERFWVALREAFAQGTARRVVLAGPRGAAGGPQRIEARPIQMKRGPRWSLTERHATRDATRNLPADEAIAEFDARLGRDFDNLHLITDGFELQLAVSRKGRETLRRSERGTAAPDAESATHDRTKRRAVDIASPFLQALGVTDAEHRLVPAMARKWKQINRFVELLAPALDAAGLGTPRPDGPPVRVLDFGSGKGYLTFAVHDHLMRLGLAPEVTGIDLKDDMVALGNDTVRALGLQGLAFEHGDVRAAAGRGADVLIALHACDTATDHAMHAGIRARAKVIMCSPCCHKQLRPQMRSPTLLLPLLRHGIHLGQEAEMLTDGLRALLLEAEGYDTQVFEFTSLEHTRKNKMILAVRRADAEDVARMARRAAPLRAQVAELKHFYGIAQQELETLLAPDGRRPEPVSRPVTG
jgi:SAM-dependent methyltransferase